MRVLVTGGAGYIGSHTVRRLAEHGHEVWVYDNLSLGHREAVPAERLIVADLADRDTLLHGLQSKRIEAVVHFAALAQVGESVKDPLKYYGNNLKLSLSLMQAMQEAGIQKMVFSSTCATYGLPTRVPIDECEKQQPINPYGRTKLAIEWALEDCAQAYHWGFAALRYFNAAGASPRGDIGEDHNPETHLIPLVLQVALRQRPYIAIFGDDYDTPDGTCIRDYIHVDDLAEAHALALQRLSPGSAIKCNLGIGQGYSVKEVIKVCEQVSGQTIPFQVSARREGDPPRLVAQATRAHEQLNWQPHYRDLESIVESAWLWHRLHPFGYKSKT